MRFFMWSEKKDVGRQSKDMGSFASFSTNASSSELSSADKLGQKPSDQTQTALLNSHSVHQSLTSSRHSVSSDGTHDTSVETDDSELNKKRIGGRRWRVRGWKTLTRASLPDRREESNASKSHDQEHREDNVDASTCSSAGEDQYSGAGNSKGISHQPFNETSPIVYTQLEMPSKEKTDGSLLTVRVRRSASGMSKEVIGSASGRRTPGNESMSSTSSSSHVHTNSKTISLSVRDQLAEKSAFVPYSAPSSSSKKHVNNAEASTNSPELLPFRQQQGQDARYERQAAETPSSEASKSNRRLSKRDIGESYSGSNKTVAGSIQPNITADESQSSQSVNFISENASHVFSSLTSSCSDDSIAPSTVLSGRSSNSSIDDETMSGMASTRTDGDEEYTYRSTMESTASRGSTVESEVAAIKKKHHPGVSSDASSKTSVSERSGYLEDKSTLSSRIPSLFSESESKSTYGRNSHSFQQSSRSCSSSLFDDISESENASWDDSLFSGIMSSSETQSVSKFLGCFCSQKKVTHDAPTVFASNLSRKLTGFSLSGEESKGKQRTVGNNASSLSSPQPASGSSVFLSKTMSSAHEPSVEVVEETKDEITPDQEWVSIAPEDEAIELSLPIDEDDATERNTPRTGAPNQTSNNEISKSSSHDHENIPDVEEEGLAIKKSQDTNRDLVVQGSVSEEPTFMSDDSESSNPGEEALHPQEEKDRYGSASESSSDDSSYTSALRRKDKEGNKKLDSRSTLSSATSTTTEVDDNHIFYTTSVSSMSRESSSYLGVNVVHSGVDYSLLSKASLFSDSDYDVDRCVSEASIDSDAVQGQASF